MKKLILKSLCVLTLSLGLAACNIPLNGNSNAGEGGDSGAGEISSNVSGDKSKGDAGWIDYAKDGDCKLALDYSGRDFYVDGIGQFSLKTAIDGDTAHFTPKVDNGNIGTMKARFYGIDTPESTG